MPLMSEEGEDLDELDDEVAMISNKKSLENDMLSPDDIKVEVRAARSASIKPD